MFVGEETSSEGCAVISSQSDEHDSQFWNFCVGFEGVGGLLWFADKLSGGLIKLNFSVVIGIRGDQLITDLLDVISEDLHFLFSFFILFEEMKKL